jgi:putative restriction endonuclease
MGWCPRVILEKACYMSLEHYCNQFTHLKRAPNSVFPELTKHKAPHKPLLLLAVMDMVERGLITNKFVSITGELIKLTLLFTSYWRIIMPVTQTNSIAFPFSRMNSEPFWDLVPTPGRQVSKESVNSTSTVAQLRQLAIGANLDEALFIFMTQPESRAELTAALLSSCFSAEGRRILYAEIGIQHQAYKYSMELERRAYGVNEDPIISLTDSVRNQGFRRAIVNCYDHRCALCGVRIITPECHTVVEAAHIRPWNKFKDDEVPDGMALCRLCHRAFDEGTMSVNDDYNVLLSRQMWAAPNTAGIMLTLANQPINRPREEKLWPDSDRLAWHRRKVGAGL